MRSAAALEGSSVREDGVRPFPDVPISLWEIYASEPLLAEVVEYKRALGQTYARSGYLHGYSVVESDLSPEEREALRALSDGEAMHGARTSLSSALTRLQTSRDTVLNLIRKELNPRCEP
jgi:hypothetical protein